jgi:hypothetical protein
VKRSPRRQRVEEVHQREGGGQHPHRPPIPLRRTQCGDDPLHLQPVHPREMSAPRSAELRDHRLDHVRQRRVRRSRGRRHQGKEREGPDVGEEVGGEAGAKRSVVGGQVRDVVLAASLGAHGGPAGAEHRPHDGRIAADEGDGLERGGGDGGDPGPVAEGLRLHTATAAEGAVRGVAGELVGEDLPRHLVECRVRPGRARTLADQVEEPAPERRGVRSRHAPARAPAPVSLLSPVAPPWFPGSSAARGRRRGCFLPGPARRRKRRPR